MRIFISADIEGATMTTVWDEATRGKDVYPAAAQQMTREVKAACDGILAVDPDAQIVVRDAHGNAINIDASQLPECVEVIRGWSGSYMCMVDGIDDSFDAVMFVGYHSAAGRNGNPLSHTYTGKTTSVRLNGMVCSEFLLFSWASALKGVPSILLTGDKMLIEDSRNLHPLLKTVAVKEGYGGMIRCIHPTIACKKIREQAEKALRQDLTKGCIKLPESFTFEIDYKEHSAAVRKSFYPGCKLIGDHTVHMLTNDFTDILRSVEFIL